MPENQIENPYSNKVILVDKPINRTSAHVVYLFKKFFKVKKAGHAGTLDPKATGLLIICTDKMTKTISEIVDAEKEYEGVIRIGAKTKTFDTESEEIEQCDVSHITETDIEKAAENFRGEIMQTPPIYSAIKQDGKRSYKLARQGKTVELHPRALFISEFTANKISETEVSFRIKCSKGTYIRTIANDFGEFLGVGGYLKSLRRTKIGNFDLTGLNNDNNGMKYRILD